MENQLFYHLWSLENSKLPFDINKDFCRLTEANDKKFIRAFVSQSRNNNSIIRDKFILELLNIYMNILYDEKHPELIKSYAIDWITHTLNILIKTGVSFDFNYLRILDLSINGFQPSNEIKVLKLDESNTPKWMSLNRNDRFFTRFITINISVSRTNTPNVNVAKKSFSHKVKTVAVFELLKLLNKGKAYNDLSKICLLVSILTGQSEKPIYNDSQKGIKFDKYHKQEIDDINQIFRDLDINIVIDINKTY